MITLEGTNAEYPLAIERLERMSTHRKTPKRPQWLLLSVLPAQPDLDLPERAMVWVSDEYRAQFLKLFEDYLERSSSAGNPRNNELVANIARIRAECARRLVAVRRPAPADREALVGGLAAAHG